MESSDLDVSGGHGGAWHVPRTPQGSSCENVLSGSRGGESEARDLAVMSLCPFSRKL